MSLSNKVNYVPYKTTITAENLNSIQSAIETNQTNITVNKLKIPTSAELSNGVLQFKNSSGTVLFAVDLSSL